MSETIQTDYSTAELMAVEMSRHLVDGDHGGTGQASIIPMAAFRLAQLTHAPNIWFFAGGIGAVNPAFDRLPRSIVDPHLSLVAEAIMNMEDNAGRETSGRWDVCFFGGMQIDKYGNINMVCIGPYDKPTLRGPGTVGTLFTATFRRVYLFVERHDKRIFVDRVDFISGAGFLTGGDSRFKVVRPECKGPQLVFTPRCVMDFEEGTRRLRLHSVHPGQTIADIIANTGCELIVPQNVPLTKPPTGEELEVLRTRVDRDGVLRKLAL